MTSEEGFNRIDSIELRTSRTSLAIKLVEQHLSQFKVPTTYHSIQRRHTTYYSFPSQCFSKYSINPFVIFSTFSASLLILLLCSSNNFFAPSCTPTNCLQNTNSFDSFSSVGVPVFVVVVGGRVKRTDWTFSRTEWNEEREVCRADERALEDLDEAFWSDASRHSVK